MKQIFTTITLFFLFILVTVSFTKKNKHTLTEFRTNSDVIECLPEGLENLEGEFEDFSSPDHASKVRRNISSLNNAQIQQIRDAIERMKKEKFKVFKNKNITVWDVMVMTHNGKTNPNAPANSVWGSCAHNSNFFFAWHRVFLFYFERTLLKYMNATSHTTPKNLMPALPYWDYQKAGEDVIPAPFISSTYFNPNTNTNKPNPLFYSDRGARMKDGTRGLKPVTKYLFDYSLNTYKTYFEFQEAIENVHGSVHSDIGGTMACPSKSAEDPLFWIHHANIDRLWQKWLNMGEGRADPDSIANAFWWNKTFKFYDSSGIVKIFKGKDVIKIADLLHVEYDDVPLPNVYPSKRDKKHPLSAAQKAIIVSDLNGVTIPSSGARMQFGQANSNTNQRRTIQSKIPQNSKPNPSKKDSIKNIYIEFENITIANNSSGTIEIYLNPEFVKQLNYENEHFLGILDLFTAQAINDHLKSNHEQSALKINITPVVNRLGLSFEDLKQSEIIFINRGENINGKENQSKLVVSIGKISLVTYGID